MVENERGDNNENSRSKVNTMMAKKSYMKSGMERDSSPLKLTTGDKKRSHRSSL